MNCLLKWQLLIASHFSYSFWFFAANIRLLFLLMSALSRMKAVLVTI